MEGERQARERLERQFPTKKARRTSKRKRERERELTIESAD
jgi:hypothetical protein